MSSESQRPLFRALFRLRPGLLFLAIVWCIALSFQVLEKAQNALFSAAVDAEWMPDRWVLPDVVSPNCEEAVIAKQSLVERSTARARIWDLGLNTGLAAGMRSAGNSGPQDWKREERSRTAEQLGIPMPELPPSRHVVTALHDFFVHLAADPECIAARLARAYSPAEGALYQFAASVGIIAWHRGISPSYALSFHQVRFYGDRAGIRRDVWLPLKADFPPKEASARVIEVLERLSRYVGSSEENGGTH